MLAGAIPDQTADTLAFFRVLADDTRLAIIQRLARTDLRAGELGDQLQLPLNALSYHLKQLRSVGMLRDRRSQKDGRDIYYSLDGARIAQLYGAAGTAIHPALGAGRAEQSTEQPAPPLRILFLCTHNRARSQLAEGLARYLGGDQVEVYSAGDQPTAVHPLTIEMLAELGIDTSRHHAKHLSEFVGQQFDYVITTCDYIHGHCPTFPGDPERIHWSFDDPSAVTGSAEVQRKAFRTARRELMTRLRLFLSLPHPVTGRRISLRSTTSTERDSA